MRLAWFSPVPPVPSGIAACSAGLVAALGAEHAIDVYVDEPVTRLAPATRSAHEFVWRHRREPYDLTVYQLGNSSHHDFLWPYLFRYPGLAVLHDAHLHHARAAALLRTKRAGDYRVEFAWNHPAARADVAEVAVAGFDSHLYYAWPMTRLVVAASRLTVVHAPSLAAALNEELPHARVQAVRLGHGEPVSDAQARAARTRMRQARGIQDDAIVFGVFGGLTPEKRIPQVLDALAAVTPYAPGVHLLLAGAAAAHYDAAADVRRRGLGSRVTITGYLESEAELTEAIAACDVSLNLRWPTAREISGPWLRALAAGRPTVITDLAHLAHVPSLDPRTWRMRSGSGMRNAGSAHLEQRAGIRDPGSGIRESGYSALGMRGSGFGTRDSGLGTRPPHPDTITRGRQPDPESRIPNPDTSIRGTPPDPEFRIPHPDTITAVTVAIDILDEDHSLRLAMRRLAVDAALRAELGAAGRRYWAEDHSMPRMVEDYRRALATAAARPSPAAALPAHLVDDGGRVLRRVLAECGLATDVWSRSPRAGESAREFLE